MSSTMPGRHRAQSDRPVKPLARLSAVLIASGGLVASMAVGAQAAPVPAQPAPLPAAPAALPTSPGVLPAAPVTLPTVRSWKKLRWGSRGAAVRKVQRVVGAYPDGVFGPKTHAAVKRWQSRNGFRPDGVVGPRNARAMGVTSRDTRSASRSSARTSSGGVLGYAKRYTGIMYRYGGSTPAGFDCSGYTQYVFAKAGKRIPRTTEGQRRASYRVSSPRPGDLVFWGSPSYHVAIYAGNGMVYDSGRAGLPSQKRKMFSGVSSFGRVG